MKIDVVNLSDISAELSRNSTPGCFVCGGHTALRTTISLCASDECGCLLLMHWFGSRGANRCTRVLGTNPYQINVGACDKHVPHLRLLHRSIKANKNVIHGHIWNARTAKTPEEFEELVRCHAHSLWQTKERERSERNWAVAEELLRWELRREPSEKEISDRAYQIWSSLKDIHARGDWYKAKKQVEQSCHVLT